MTSPSSHLRTVLDHLSFPVDDTEAANSAFEQWREHADSEAKRSVDLWTYCYVCRYFLSKSIRGEFRSATDADELIARTYRKVEEKRSGVRNPERYASWVSVVCKNTFLNHKQRAPMAKSINAELRPRLQAEPNARTQIGFVEEAFTQAIEQLPDYLQKAAQLYFLKGKDYEEISTAIGKPVPTVRSYKHKAVKRLREDDTLREYVEHLL